jgi:hypothetical protein
MPSAPPRDLVKTTVASISAAMPAAVSRRIAECRRVSATISAAGMKVTMFSARSLGLPNMPLTAPPTRPSSMRLTPRA